MWKAIVEFFSDPEPQRLRRIAARHIERYESEAVCDRRGNRWGRHGEEIESAGAY